MTDPWDGKTLLGGGRGEQRAGTTEQDLLKLPVVQLVQQIAAEGNCAASAAGTAGMHILLFGVEDQGAAVHQLAPQRKAVLSGQLQKHFLSCLTQVAGDDPIKILGSGGKILKMRPNGGGGCWG